MGRGHRHHSGEPEVSVTVMDAATGSGGTAALSQMPSGDAGARYQLWAVEKSPLWVVALSTERPLMGLCTCRQSPEFWVQRKPGLPDLTGAGGQLSRQRRRQGQISWE